MDKCISALAVALAVTPAAAAQPANQHGGETLYRFTGGSDGGGPFGGLVSDGQGNLYGTTAAGGLATCESPIDAPGCGVVFEVSRQPGKPGGWAETVLYTFGGGSDGNGPLSGLVRDASGNLFGTTEVGGMGTGACAGGCGTVFEVSPPAGGNGAWRETVLYSFGATATDGEFPYGGLIQDAQGNLYGTTPDGGAAGLGTIYEISPQGGGKWTETILHDFRPENGAAPVTNLLLGADGTLFGTALEGFVGGKLCKDLGACGTVFALRPPKAGKSERSFSVLFRFPGNGNDGLYPMSALVIDRQGRLIGTTENFGISHGQQANGTVFRLSPPTQAGQSWTLETLLAFTTVGSYPEAPVLQGPHRVLYGTTLQSGTGINGGGLVFALSPPAPGGNTWQETPLFTFSAAGDGAMPVAGVIADSEGRLYGTASTGGGDQCMAPFCGTVFRVTPPN
jgi:uncharacterized repeat protein (TIGR03803 family)